MANMDYFEHDEVLSDEPHLNGNHNIWTAREALDAFDMTWYNRTSQLGRWMDILGDYAGDELFLLNGDSLFCNILNDPLLALGKKNDPSFQFLHARYSLERALNEYIHRRATFEIVFFEDQRHVTTCTGASAFVTASRCLLRNLLKASLFHLPVIVHTFQSLSDPHWIIFYDSRKPMFIITDDGGLVDADTELEASRALIQRTFLFDLLSRGMAVSLIRGAEFRNSKIFSLVYEQNRVYNARNRVNPRIWDTRHRVEVELDATLPRQLFWPSSNRTDWFIAASKEFLKTVGINDGRLRSLLYVFLAHGLLLTTIAVPLRCQPLPNLSHESSVFLREKFFPSLFHCLARHVPRTKMLEDIDLDGRIFLNMVHVISNQYSSKRRFLELFGTELSLTLNAIWAAIDSEDTMDLTSLVGFTGNHPLTQLNTVSQMLPVLPFSHPALNRHLSSLYVEGDSSLSSTAPYGRFDLHSTLGSVFKDIMHWHNSRAPILPKHLESVNVKITSMDSKARLKSLRRNQDFHARLQKQAQTLTGALGRPIDQIVIAAIDSAKTQAVSKNNHPQQSKNQRTKLTSKERILRQVQSDKQAKKEASDSNWWNGKKGRFADLQNMSLKSQIEEIDSLLRNPRIAGSWLATEIPLYRLDLELRTWIQWQRSIPHSKLEQRAIRDQFRVNILRMIKEQAVRTTPTTLPILTSVLTALGFFSVASSLLGVSNLPDRKLSFDFVKVLKKGFPIYAFMALDGNEHPTEWLLRCFGDYMDRSLDSKPDERVQFEPDGWQRQVLDSLDDEDTSVLVVAPTSAGKTFIAYYAMEKILRSSNNGILVYVAPTKALVTQIAAEVASRYKKAINGRSFWAIHTRDIRIHDPQKCQILITVPEILAIMLLSPPLARVWTPRLKRIILDEIHSIGQEDGGSIWEQILLLSPCPIIGLSATVGDPESFNTWLSSVQAAHGFKHTFIQHTHRYSHLRKFYYLPRDPRRITQPFNGFTKFNTTGRLRFLHPVSLLASGMTRALPLDLALEAGDCLTLFRALEKHADAYPALLNDIQDLLPAQFFPPDTFIKQADIIRYEEALKRILTKLIDMPFSHAAISPLQSVVLELTDDSFKISDPLHHITTPRDILEADLINLVSDLQSGNELPALIFSFDRDRCETQAEALLSQLENSEAIWRETSLEWKNKMKAWELYCSREKQRERANERALKRQQTEDHEASAPSDKNSWEAHFDPDDPFPDFSLAGLKTSYDKSALESDLKDLVWTSTPAWALKAIKRGIAVHHSGMNKAYRTLVETLFRVGFLRVVFATGTLALGINAPCKTTVFCGDSTFLTALQFRQAAGRAGRRGFDRLGKVVFYGIVLERVQRLILSRIPPITGQFPLTTMLCLRLFNLLAGSDNSEFATKAVSSILSLPQISLGSDTDRDGVLHHMRFSIDYLLRAHLLDDRGRPLNLTGIATHLYYHEPYNLAFVALLRSGVIHRICNQAPKVTAMRELVLVLSHLFGRRRLPRSALNNRTLSTLIKGYPSLIVLPPLPELVKNVLREHSELTRRIFTGYAWTYASQNELRLGPDNVLPLSGFYGTENPPQDSEFIQTLRSTTLKLTVRSIFVGNSGHTDTFNTVDELCRESRYGLHLNQTAIPSMDDLLSSEDSPYSLNAYLLDFYTHGQVDSLVLANGIRRGDVWYFLQDFVLALKTIQASIHQLLISASDASPVAETDEDNSEDTMIIPEEYDPDDKEDPSNTDDPRPPGVDNMDWKVYEVISDVLKDFDLKFRKMWA